MIRVLCVTFCVLLAGCGLFGETHQQKMKRLAPAEYRAHRGAQATKPRARVLRVRVLVDEGHRRATREWRARIEQQFQRANAVLLDTFNVRMEIVEIQKWSHTVQSNDLEDLLQALYQADSGDKVDRVIGFTASHASYTSNQHMLGLAILLGKHTVIRGMNDDVERKAMVSKLSEKDGSSIYRRRVQHKETMVLLHEIAHTMGAVHVRERGFAMSTFYSLKTSRFSPANERLLARAFDLHFEHKGAQAPWQFAMHEELGKLSRGEFAEQVFVHEIKEVLKEARPDMISIADREVLREIHPMIQRERYREALARLEPILERSPAHEDVARLACYLFDRMRDARAKQWCSMMRTLLPKEAYALEALAGEALRRKALLEAFAHLKELETLHAGIPTTGTRDWLRLSSLYLNVGALQKALEVLPRAGMMVDATKLRTYITNRQRHMCLYGVPAEQEPALFEQLMTMESHLLARRTRERDALLKTMKTSFSDAAHMHALECRLAIMKKPTKASRKSCDRAVALAPKCAMAHFGVGVHQYFGGDLKKARASMEHARDLMPDDPYYWTSLQRFFEQTRNKKALRDLREKYKARFGKEL